MYNDTLYKTLTNDHNEIIEIHYDNSPLNPLEEMNTLFHYDTWEMRSVSLQENNYAGIDDFVDSFLGEEAFETIESECLSKQLSQLEFLKIICQKLDRVGIFALPILKYEHSLVKYYIGDHVDRWDGSVVGFAWNYKSTIYDQFSLKRLSKQMKAKLEEIISFDLTIYTNWCNGEVFGYKRFDSSGEEVDSCWGFYNSDNVLEEILDHAQNHGEVFYEKLPETVAA